ncbi:MULTISPECIES: MHYT domain-containing protein [unclassified Nostoc]|uniref:MHYT domain-containing protein n=1 Tax=unclassified Nostoc TaxID=2593658 RepID=UPI002AD2319D|nr:MULTISPECIES: MHYT domain-containing protein [unclassified Nostoc]MDZ8029514.1 MHYT domain-containing protein [Nostoc sp. DedSLP04]MDZ8128673.1 MHYT domain-containing protein [Nostoc sp. DedQUE07]MDZ8136153.1 MHYT domain-containing protein [Nostoc sp. DedQUE04]
MTATYDIQLAILSFCIAVFAAYTALDLAGRIMAARNLARLFWLAGGAAAMGIGIWSMHFIAMLTYQFPVPVFYDLPIVILSLMVAIAASGRALFITRDNLQSGHRGNFTRKWSWRNALQRYVSYET